MYDKEYHRQYKANRRATDPEWKDKQNAYVAERKRAAFLEAARIKAEAKCVDCREGDPVVLDFDHVDPKNKVESISQMIRKAANWERVLEEISKCEVRCANCHRRRTAAQQGWYS